MTEPEMKEICIMLSRALDALQLCRSLAADATKRVKAADGLTDEMCDLDDWSDSTKEALDDALIHLLTLSDKATTVRRLCELKEANR